MVRIDASSSAWRSATAPLPGSCRRASPRSSARASSEHQPICSSDWALFGIAATAHCRVNSVSRCGCARQLLRPRCCTSSSRKQFSAAGRCVAPPCPNVHFERLRGRYAPAEVGADQIAHVRQIGHDIADCGRARLSLTARNARDATSSPVSIYDTSACGLQWYEEQHRPYSRLYHAVSRRLFTCGFSRHPRSRAVPPPSQPAFSSPTTAAYVLGCDGNQQTLT